MRVGAFPSRQRLRERTQLGHRFIHGNQFGDSLNAGFTSPTGLSRGSVTRRMHATMHGVKGEEDQMMSFDDADEVGNRLHEETGAEMAIGIVKPKFDDAMDDQILPNDESLSAARSATTGIRPVDCIWPAC